MSWVRTKKKKFVVSKSGLEMRANLGWREMNLEKERHTFYQLTKNFELET